MNFNDNKLTTERQSINKIYDVAENRKEDGVDSEGVKEGVQFLHLQRQLLALRLSESTYAHSNVMMQTWQDWIKQTGSRYLFNTHTKQSRPLLWAILFFLNILFLVCMHATSIWKCTFKFYLGFQSGKGYIYKFMDSSTLICHIYKEVLEIKCHHVCKQSTYVSDVC